MPQNEAYAMEAAENDGRSSHMTTTTSHLEADTSKHLAHMIHLFDPEKAGNAYVMEGANFFNLGV